MKKITYILAFLIISSTYVFADPVVDPASIKNQDKYYMQFACSHFDACVFFLRNHAQSTTITVTVAGLGHRNLGSTANNIAYISTFSKVCLE